MATWLVTGGAGFIGSNFVRAARAARSVDVVVLDALSYAGNLANIRELIDSAAIEFVHADIRNVADIEAVFGRHDVERVIHLAAESHVDRSILDARDFVATNVAGTLNLLTVAREHWERRGGRRMFVHVSTDEVYGTLGPTDPPFNERTPYAPSSPYAASKAAADHLVRAWHRTYDFPAVITNCSNNYGPWQFPEKLIPLMILSCVEGKELPVYGDGLQVRDWLHVADHCDALLAVLDGGVSGETYCIGAKSEKPNLELVTAICDLVDARLGRRRGTGRKLIRHVHDRPGHDRRYAIDAQKIASELGWSPKRDFATALPEVVDWYLAHLQWVEEIRSGEYRRFYSQQYGERLRLGS
jgi:dTDP-glucose 4,6-dehydratase